MNNFARTVYHSLIRLELFTPAFNCVHVKTNANNTNSLIKAYQPLTYAYTILTLHMCIQYAYIQCVEF